VDNSVAVGADRAQSVLMSRPPSPIPSRLGDGAFTVRQGASAGLTRRRMRGSDLVRITHGVRVSTPPAELMDKAVAYALALPEPIAFSHSTAARLHGLPLGRDWVPSEPLDVMRPTEASRLRRTGVVFHRGLETRATVVHKGLLITSAEDTWCDLAAALSLDERVILADAVVNAWNGVPLDHLVEAVGRRVGQRGVRLMREALLLVRTRSRSRMETVARLAFLRGGLPEPELNCTIFDSAGEWLSCPDFVWRRKKVAAEYDGEHHRLDKRQWRSDHARRRAVVGDGWRLHVITADDFAGPVRTERLVDAIATDLAD
jgi:hypothetical protein